MGPGSQGHEVPGSASVRVMPVTVDRWPDLEKAFGSRGDPSGCWCQWFFAGAQVGPQEQPVSASELYHGSLSTFLRARFAEVGRPAPARPVVRLRLTGSQPRPDAASAAGQQKAGNDR